jgi:ABC-2 type transport system ATP-binding protein
MLRIQHLTKNFYISRTETVPVVDDISLEVKKGQVFGYLGANGAGKTTTVKMLINLLFPDKGSVTINGIDSGKIDSRKKIGFVPEQPRFYRHFTAEETLRYVGELFELEEKIIAKRTKELLKKVGLSDAKNMPTKQFSKGMHQRLAFATALMNDPELLIMDEPLDGLDPLGRLDFKKLILELKKKGKTIFFSSHILADVEEICDEVAILKSGKIIAQGSPRKLAGKKTLEEYFVNKVTGS